MNPCQDPERKTERSNIHLKIPHQTDSFEKQTHTPNIINNNIVKGIICILCILIMKESESSTTLGNGNPARQVVGGS